MPAMAPRAVPRRQIRPPKKAGASCAMAAKASKPDRGELRLAGRAVIHIGEDQDREDRQTRRTVEQQRADIGAVG